MDPNTSGSGGGGGGGGGGGDSGTFFDSFVLSFKTMEILFYLFSDKGMFKGIPSLYNWSRDIRYAFRSTEKLRNPLETADKDQYVLHQWFIHNLVSFSRRFVRVARFLENPKGGFLKEDEMERVNMKLERDGMSSTDAVSHFETVARSASSMRFLNEMDEGSYRLFVTSLEHTNALINASLDPTVLDVLAKMPITIYSQDEVPLQWLENGLNWSDEEIQTTLFDMYVSTYGYRETLPDGWSEDLEVLRGGGISDATASSDDTASSDTTA
jgi:hypothetical protein